MTEDRSKTIIQCVLRFLIVQIFYWQDCVYPKNMIIRNDATSLIFFAHRASCGRQGRPMTEDRNGAFASPDSSGSPNSLLILSFTGRN